MAIEYFVRNRRKTELLMIGGQCPVEVEIDVFTGKNETQEKGLSFCSVLRSPSQV